MDTITGLFGIAALVGLAILAVAGLLMPIIVWDMHTHLKEVKKTLAAMEHMMRHGK